MHAQTTDTAAVPHSLIDLLAMRASERPDELLYRFLSDEGAEFSWTYADLQHAAYRIAAALEPLGVEGEPVLLLYPTGLEYVAAFFGCLYAGAIAVPAYPPRPGRTSQRLETIARDSNARVALTTAEIRESLDRDARQSPLLCALAVVATDELSVLDTSDFRPRSIESDTVAFLQYTSGSTGDPKGVIVTHGNLLHNLRSIHASFTIGAPTSTVSWLPIYHDMGLIGGVLTPLYAGGPLTLMSPKKFQDSPFSWLKAISNYGATHAGGPTFAYEWCLRRTTAEQRASLDLSRWRVAFCGAEPIRRETLTEFCQAFAPAGFQAEALRPCYGLAEATLMVTSRMGGEELLMQRVSKQALGQGRLVTGDVTQSDALWMVGSGSIVGKQQVAIVDPETCRTNPPGRIGEIWVKGPSVTDGYWKREQLSTEVFEARLVDTGEGPFLRTGDLGCFYDGQLFVTGRIKDLIIVRGRNHYPQDIELTSESSHADLLSGGGAAFGLQGDGPEQIVLVHEVRREAIRGLDASAVIRAICQAVAREHEVRLDAVGLVRPGGIPRTSSGKVERHAACRRFNEKSFEFIELWKSPLGGGSTVPPEDRDEATAVSPPTTNETPIQWLIGWLAKRLELDRSQIDAREPLAMYGLDSLMAVELLHDAERAFSRQLDVGELIDASSIAQVAEQLSGHPSQEPAANGVPVASPLAVVLPTGVVRPSWRGPFGDRADGILIRGESPVRQIMPYLMRSRGESLVYHEAQYDVARTLPWLDAYNRRHPEQRATLLDLFLWASAYVAHARPGLNRFICGRRNYQRREVSISFVAKKSYQVSAEMVTIKLGFPEQQNLFSKCVERIASGVEEACHGPPRYVDRETALVMKLPRFVLRAAMVGYRILDHCNLLPGKVFANDPLYTSLFVTSLGSVGMDTAFHHLYEHGTCSLFAALGLPKKMLVATADGRSETRQLWPVRWTLDERIVDGFYSAACLRMLKSILENPAEFVPAESRHDGGS
jgi:acyl-CoA synthetase (AMP-forming)/AMP-acid ligase II/acyl carrier protein